MSVAHDARDGERLQSDMSTKAKAGLVLAGFLVIAGILLFAEHRAHVLGLFVWLPLLACPLMHFFMHGHGHHHHGGGRPNDPGSV
ncbi:DUF2933 domain-containing protein [Bradyrhizobium diazoefficiens]|nr:DUF2933 domain-containing protein [Bradyrhizobium diazoefficiens]MBR0926765.1 DUF2933 domain-containing protein [Bradyrhizobium diazoefficiens]